MAAVVETGVALDAVGHLGLPRRAGGERQASRETTARTSATCRRPEDPAPYPSGPPRSPGPRSGRRGEPRASRRRDRRERRGSRPGDGCPPVRRASAPVARTSRASTDLRLRFHAEAARRDRRPRLRPRPSPRSDRPGRRAWARDTTTARRSSRKSRARGTPPRRPSRLRDGPATSWPPIWRAQRVGELSECFVVPARRGRGVGRALLRALLADPRRAGVDRLSRARPRGADDAPSPLRRAGFDPLFRVLERPSTTRDDSLPLRAARHADVPSLLLLFEAMVQRTRARSAARRSTPACAPSPAHRRSRWIDDSTRIVLAQEESASRRGLRRRPPSDR